MAKDPLAVIDFITVKQEADAAAFDMDVEDLSLFFNKMCDKGIHPYQSQRIMLHTHPGNSATPSGTDEANFTENWSKNFTADWAVMFILARGGDMSCRIRFNTAHGIRTEVKIPAGVDYSIPFIGSDHEAWEAEYVRNIKKTEHEPYYPTFQAPTQDGWYRNKNGSWGKHNETHPSNDQNLSMRALRKQQTAGYKAKDGGEYNWDNVKKQWIHTPPKGEAAQKTKPDRLPTENRVPLWYHMKDFSIEEIIQLLGEFKIDLDEVEDYFVYVDEKGTQWAEVWENDQIKEEWAEAEKEWYNLWLDDWMFIQQSVEQSEFKWSPEDEENLKEENNGFLADDEPEVAVLESPAPPQELAPTLPPTEEKPK